MAPGDRRAVVRFLRRAAEAGASAQSPAGPGIHGATTLYRVFVKTSEHGTVDRQYVKVTSLTRGRRLAVPLLGRGWIDGNVRIVLRPDRRAVEVHMPCGVKAGKPKGDAVIGLDAGVREALARSGGRKYGAGLGPLLDRLSEETNQTGKARNHLSKVAGRAEAPGDDAKVRRVRTFNLGRQTLEAQRQRGAAEMTRRVGEAVRAAAGCETRGCGHRGSVPPAGRTRSRTVSRIESRWMRSARRGRLEFPFEPGGSRRVTISAAYTSQTCPHPACGCVYEDNRHGNRFPCLRCGHAGAADVIASRNIAARVPDTDSHLWTAIFGRPRDAPGDPHGEVPPPLGRGAALTAPGKTPAEACVP